MTTTVTPATFRFVHFDAEQITAVAEGLLAALGMSDRDVAIVVDETTPLGRTAVRLGDDGTVTVNVESGAFEDLRRPRQQSETAVATALGRLLLRVHDRLTGGFGEAPQDDQLSLAQVAAWDAYCVGRLERLGVAVNQQRWRYNFRNRHGFTDASDAGFDRLWGSDGLAWGELAEISRSASTASAVVASA
jgi:hypothetical protein